MARFWQDLQSQLGGTLTTETSDNGKLSVLYGELPACEFTVLGDATRALVVSLSFSEGEHLDDIRERLSGDEVLNGLLAKSKLAPPGENNAFFTSEEFHWYLPPDQSPSPGAGRMAEVVRLMASVLVRGAPMRDRFCWGCGGLETELIRTRGMTMRHCPECLALVSDCSDRAEALNQEHDSDPGINLAPLALEQLSPSEMLERGRGLQDMYQRNPGQYWWRMIALVILGQVAMAAGVAVMSVLGLALVGLLVWAVVTGKAVALLLAAKVLVAKGIKLLLLAGLALVGLVSSLWPRRPPEQDIPGVRLERQDQPEFFGWLDAMAARVDAPPVDLVILNEQLNAYASERKVKGEWTRTVGIGVPMLELAEQDELAAVMAHELGHLRHQDSRSAWVHRTAYNWASLASRMGGQGMLVRFARWYVPRFWLYADVLSREREKAADEASLRVVPASVQAEQLIRVTVLGHLYDAALLEGLNRLARDGGAASVDPVRVVLDEVRMMAPERIQETYRECLEEEPNWTDSHPVLSVRLSDLGVEAPDRCSLRLDVERPASLLLRDYPRVRAEAMKALVSHCEIKLKLEERFWKGRTARAERLQAAEDASPSAPGQILLGRIYSSLGRDDEARACLEKALDLNPGDRAAMSDLVGNHFQHLRFDDAAGVLERHLPADTCDVDLLMAGARCAEKAGRVEQACGYYHRMLALGPPPAIREQFEGRLKKLESENPVRADPAGDPRSDQFQEPA
ncbi:MAG: M48 family metalloprotease [Candidatus Eremiobacterota bacterium]